MLFNARCRVAFFVVVALWAGTTVAATREQMQDRLRQMERMDFLDGIEEANDCTAQRDFSCAQKALLQARDLAADKTDMALLAQAKASLNAEKKRADEEREQQEEEDRLRRAEEQQIAAAEAQERRAQREADDAYQRKMNQIAMNNAAILAFGNGLSQEKLNALMAASTQDVMNDTGGSNMRETTERLRSDSERSHKERMQQINAAREQREQQKQRDQAALQRSLLEQRDRDSQRRPQVASRTASETVVAAASSGPTAAQRQQQEEKARQERAAQQAADNKARDEAAVLAEQERQQRLAKQKADREAQRAAEKAKEDADKKEYLRQTAQQTTLKARMCYGKSYVVGIRPRIKPEKVSCVDMHYRARCADSQAYVTGVVKNFVGMGTDCFTGDTADMPAMSCPVADITLEVTQAVTCGG